MGRAAAAVLVAGVLLAAGCDGGSTPGPSPTTGPPSSASPTIDPTAALGALAAAGRDASFSATYVARQRGKPHRATWEVWHTPRSVRVDVVTGRTRATLITTPRAAYACRKAPHEKTCLRVATGDRAIPAPLRLSAEQLFTDDQAALAAHAGTYAVTRVPVDVTRDGALATACFAIRHTAKTPRPRVADATYCFTDAGVVAAVHYPSRSSVVLQHVTMRRPAAGAFRPYAHPTPLR